MKTEPESKPETAESKPAASAVPTAPVEGLPPSTVAGGAIVAAEVAVKMAAVAEVSVSGKPADKKAISVEVKKSATSQPVPEGPRTKNEELVTDASGTPSKSATRKESPPESNPFQKAFSQVRDELSSEGAFFARKTFERLRNLKDKYTRLNDRLIQVEASLSRTYEADFNKKFGWQDIKEDLERELTKVKAEIERVELSLASTAQPALELKNPTIWFAELDPLPKLLAILLCAFEELPWEHLSEVFDYVVEAFGGRNCFLSAPEKDALKIRATDPAQERINAEDGKQPSLADQESVFDKRFSALVKQIGGISELRAEDRRIIVSFQSKQIKAILALITQDYYDVLLQTGDKLIQFSAQADLSYEQRSRCAEAIGGLLHIGANYLIEEVVNSWILIPDTQHGARTLRATFGSLLRAALNEGRVTEKEVRTWFREMSSPYQRPKQVVQTIRWSIAAACKEIGQTRIKFALEELRWLFTTEQSPEVQEAVRYSELTLVMRGKYREVFLAAADWATTNKGWEQAELYVKNFIALLNFFVQNASMPVEQSDSRNAADPISSELRVFLVSKDDEIDRAVVQAYRAVATIVDLDMITLERMFTAAFLADLEKAFGVSLSKESPRDILYHNAFVCLRSWVLKFGAEQAVCDRVGNILKDIVALVLQDAIAQTKDEKLLTDTERLRHSVSAIARVLSLINEIISLWDREDLEPTEKDEKEDARTRKRNIQAMLRNVFDERYWSGMEDLLVQIILSEQTLISDHSHNFIEIILRWTHKFAFANRDDPQLKRAAEALNKVDKRLDQRVAGKRRFDILSRKAQFQRFLRNWSNPEMESIKRLLLLHTQRITPSQLEYEGQPIQQSPQPINSSSVLAGTDPSS
ncbi:MAG: hypothetical protein HZA90_18030 [Verrucomicrobia bacterium]|nr:hypothetical protein [Verrucomicrobiota bacterium]